MLLQIIQFPILQLKISHNLQSGPKFWAYRFGSLPWYSVGSSGKYVSTKHNMNFQYFLNLRLNDTIFMGETQDFSYINKCIFSGLVDKKV